MHVKRREYQEKYAYNESTRLLRYQVTARNASTSAALCYGFLIPFHLAYWQNVLILQPAPEVYEQLYEQLS